MWNEILGNNDLIHRIYKKVPKLMNVSIDEITIDRSGKRIRIGFTMPESKNKTCLGLKKYRNITYVKIDFMEIINIYFVAHCNKYIGNITITKNENNLFITNVNGTLELKIKAKDAVISSVKCYQVYNEI